MLADSPAIDAGNTNENNDQRGASRDSNPDIGAFEFGGTPIMTQESNDTLLRAIYTGLTLNNDGTFSYSGEIGDNPNVDPEQDVDLFKFDLGIGDRLRLPDFIDLLDENGNDTNVDAEVQVFDSTGIPISPPLFDPSDPGYVIYQANQAGTFYVGISGSGNSGYDPNIEGSGFAGTPGKYELTIETIGRQMGGTQSKLYFSRDAAFNEEGLYILDTSTGNPSLVGTNSSVTGNVGLAPSDTSSFLYGSEPYNLLKINADGSVANSVGSGNLDANGLAYDATNNILYGINGSNFYTVNQNTGNPISQLNAPPVFLQGLAFGNGGVYGLGDNQDLLFYDPNTDNWSVIGDTGISSWQDAGLAFDAEENVLYAKRYNDTLLYEIDVSTAQTISIGDTGFLEGGGLALVSDDVYEEPNDTIARATNTGLTQNNDGTFSYFGEIGDNTNVLPEDDVDFFKFDLGLGERVRIPQNIELLDENGNFIANAEVELFDETGQSFPTNLNFLFTDTDNYEIYEANEAGTFYLGISSDGNWNYDPNIEGSGSGSAAGNYGLTIETIGRDIGATQSDRLFAVKDDGFGLVQIVELNPVTGEEINSLSPPETLSPGSQGLAFDGNSLFFVNDNGFSTELWELNPDTGEVRDSDFISGSGGFNGLAALDGKVYILDGGDSIIEFDPVNDIVTKTLDIDAINNGVSLGGGLGAITGPNALLAIDFNSPEVLEINPTTGAITNSFPISYPSDGIAVINNEIYVGKNDISPQIEVFDRSGTSQRTIDFDYNVSALGGDNSGAVKFEEPNDTRVRATHTGLTHANHGTFSYSGEIGDNTNLLQPDDVDLFEIHLDLGETVRLPANIELLDENGNYSGNAEVQLFNYQGLPVPLSLDPLDPNYQIYDVYDGYMAGTFYVGISGGGNFSYDPDTEGSGSGNTAGNYSLTIETIGREMGGYDISNLYFSQDSASSGQGLYTLDTATGAATLVGTNNATSANVGLAPSDSSNILYGSDPNGLLTINADGSGTNSVGIEQTNGLAYDAPNDILYGADGFDFYTVDPNTGNQILPLASPSTALQGLAFGNGGVYGLGLSQDLLFYDPNTDNWSVIGNTGQSWPDAGLAFDAQKNVLYAKQGGDTSLYEINVSTAVATVIGDTGILEGGGLALVSNRVFEESNDTLTRATHTGLTLTNPGTYTYSGEIGDNTNLLQPDDVDLFKFDLDQGETVTLPGTIEILDDNSSPVGNAEIKLFDSLGNSVNFDLENSSVKIYQATATGTFYVGISGSGNTNYDPNTEGSGNGSSSTSGNYDLTVITTSSRSGDEPNETLVEATDTGLTLTDSGRFNYSGEISDNLDVDIFKFDLDIGETVRIALTDLFDGSNNSNGVAGAQLFDATGNGISTESDPSDPSIGIFTAQETGTFYFAVSSEGASYEPNTLNNRTGGSNTGTYSLTIETVGRTLGVDETNDILAEAIDTGLTLTNSGIFNYSGEIGDNTNLLPENDVDLFKFELDIGKK